MPEAGTWIRRHIMSAKKLSTHARITLDDRIVIEEFLDQGTRLKDLTRQIKKHPSSVTCKIKRFRSHRLPSHCNKSARNNCAHRKSCLKRDVCKLGCRRRCSICSKCNQACPDFDRDECPTPNHFPLVCTACPTKNGCHKIKFFYV